MKIIKSLEPVGCRNFGSEDTYAIGTQDPSDEGVYMAVGFVYDKKLASLVEKFLNTDMEAQTRLSTLLKAPPNDILVFRYCECGCKGSSADWKGHSYWIYNDLSKTRYSFRAIRGHGFTGGTTLGFTSTFKKAKQLCIKDLKSQIS